jgi:hypothetical protein
VSWENWEPNPRDILIDKVRRGQLTPKEAEAEAEAKGFGPIAETADPEQFDPLRMPWWTLPMAVAWIAWRDAALVQQHCADYRKHCTHWVGRSWSIPTADGKSSETINGWELERWTPTTLMRLTMQEAHRGPTGTLQVNKRMTVAEAEKDLWTALGEGKLIAVAKDSGESVVEIPKRDWSYLKHCEENDQDVMKLHVLDSTPTYKELTLARADLMRLWQAWPIEAHMIEPMTRTGTSGYVPLSSALLWVCTSAGTQKADLGDIVLWEQSVAELLPLFATGEIEVVGQGNSGGLPERLPGHYFSKIKVSQPLSDYPFLFSDGPWISCCPYIDQKHWDSDFNDKIFIEKSGPASWTHLQVKKVDVSREFSTLLKGISLSSFPSEQIDPAANPETRKRKGRKPQYDWEDVELFVKSQLDARGDFDDSDQVADWRCQADLERSVADYFSKRGNERVPAVSSVREKIGPMVDRWRTERNSQNSQ